MEPEDATAVFEGLEGREYVHEPGFGGHDFVFVDELSLGQTCSICLVAMRNPVQTMCGHRFCEDCLLRTFRCCVLFLCSSHLLMSRHIILSFKCYTSPFFCINGEKGDSYRHSKNCDQSYFCSVMVSCCHVSTSRRRIHD